MKSFLRIVSAAVLSFALAGCGPVKVKGPGPNPAGHWLWKGQAQATWRIDFQADGTFEREITDPAGQKVSVVHGQWSLFNTQTEPTWLNRHGIYLGRSPEDKLMRKAGYHAHIQWSPVGMLSMHYSAPVSAEPIPNPNATAATPPATPAKAPATPAQEMIVGETQSVRTHTDNSTGEVFLDLGGKTYQKVK
jgi:hypothetical protein